MESKEEKYKKVLNLLRTEKPEIRDKEAFVGKVMDLVRIKKERSNYKAFLFIFRWTEIVWFRRILVAASVALIILFAWQQGVILTQISYLNSKASFNGDGSFAFRESDIERGLLFYRLSGKKFTPETVTVSREKMDQLLKSVDELQKGYDELLDIIRSDTAFKKLIDERVAEKENLRIKL